MILLNLLIAILWIIIGVWICYKRNWYEDMHANIAFCVFASMLMPASLLLAFLKTFIFDKWESESWMEE